MWYATVSWPPSELIGLWLRSGNISNFGAILTKWNGSNLGFPGIFWKTHRGNGLKFCMLMYLDHFQNWSDYGYSLQIFLILMLFWLSETGKIWGFQAFWSCSVDFPHYFGWNWSYLAFLGIIWRTCGSKCRGEGGGIFLTLCVECCLVNYVPLIVSSWNFQELLTMTDVMFMQNFKVRSQRSRSQMSKPNLAVSGP